MFCFPKGVSHQLKVDLYPFYLLVFQIYYEGLSAINIGSEELAISRAHSDETLIHANQASASIDRRGHGDQNFSFGIRKSCEK